MDPVTIAITTAVLADLSKDTVKGSYKVLKDALKKRFGPESDLANAVDKLEKRPESEGRKATVQEEVSIAKVNDDSELLKLAQDLLDALKAQPNTQTVINQNISNVKYAATSGTGPASISNITENQASKDDREDS
jgi:beta-phosphoglucomutase-like phosphatase (HAD superfamily)